MNLLPIDSSWTLFLDRDGVLNKELFKDYVKNLDELEVLPGVFEALENFNNVFGKIFIITNQRGVGLGIMTLEQLNEIHDYFISEINKHQGRIDKIYFCTDTNSDSVNRKPNNGMALQAKNNFPEINFEKSIMVGNHLSDMQFGKNINAFTVFLATTNPEITFPHPLIDARFNTLLEFSEALTKSR